MRGGLTSHSEANPPHVSAAAIRTFPSMPAVRERRRYDRDQRPPTYEPMSTTNASPTRNHSKPRTWSPLPTS
jgi:hypothetical protein